MIARSWVSGTSADGCCRRTKWIAHPVRSGVVPARWQPRRSVLDFTITATYFVTAIGAAFQKYDDILGHREHKDTEKNTLQVARSTRRRAAAGEACQPQTNDQWTVARSFVCGRRASRRGLRCRPPASSASVSQCLRGLSKSIRRRNYEILYLVLVGFAISACYESPTSFPGLRACGVAQAAVRGENQLYGDGIGGGDVDAHRAGSRRRTRSLNPGAHEKDQLVEKR